MNGPAPLVSIIVPVLNGESTLRECLVSLLRMDFPPERREILVVDNGSTDRTAEIVRSLPVRYLTEEQRGPSRARNRGIEASQGEILAFTDADCVVSTGWLWELVRGFDDEGVGAVEGETVDFLPSTVVAQATARRGSYSRQIRLMSPLAPYVITANVAVRREVFRRIGLFDPGLPAAEDVDFSWRFLQAGDLKLSYNPRAIVFHRHRSTAWSLLAQQVRNGRGLALLHAKYPARLPWGWRQELRAWRAVAGSGGAAARDAVRRAHRNGTTSGASDARFGFLRKLGVRLGFLWETLARSSR